MLRMRETRTFEHHFFKEADMKQAKLVHIAVRSGEPRSLADFYKRAFGLKEVLSNRRAVDLWDGYLFLAINPPSANGPMGLNHFGFVVDNVDFMRPVLSRAGASKVEARPAGRSFTDWRVHDPEGNPIDLSARGYNTIPAERLQNDLHNGAMSEVRRLVILSQDPQELARFYTAAFGMEPVKTAAHKVVLTDGVMQLVLLNLDPNPVSGLYCYGLAGNKDCDETLRRLEDSKLAVSWGPDWVDENKRQMHLCDPEENLVTVFGMS
jgi:catechol 2,3-dioxygenase-like lactoylglutathione lyase family enzyme